MQWSPARTNQVLSGLGPSASKIYFTDETSSWGLSADLLSFSELHGMDGTTPRQNKTTIGRVSPTVGARLHPRVIFNSQFLVEDGGAESSDTVALRKGQAVILSAYVDWLHDNHHSQGLRIGHQLVPIGWTNTRNESVTYFGVLRPELERELIPDQWHENGITFWREQPNGNFALGVFNSLNAQGFKGETFLNGGRSHGQKAPSEDLMTVTRANLHWEMVTLGGSLAFGQSGQRIAAYRRGSFGIGEFHIRLAQPQFEFFAQFANARLVDADSISIMNTTVMGESAKGHSVHIAARIYADHPENHHLWLFARRSVLDLHDRVPEGLLRDDSLHKTQITFGLSYFPIPNWVFKADYAFKKSARSDEEDEFHLGTSVTF